MSTARVGREREHRVVAHMEANGWRKIMRAAASKGSGDLLMGHPFYGGALVQVGGKSKRLGPKDRKRLFGDAELIGALALLVVEHARPRRYVAWLVTLDTPGKWERWEL